METEAMRPNPIAVFMSFGTKGDVYPIAALAVAFASDQKQYHVVLITHSSHEILSEYLVEKNIDYFPVSTPPVISPYEDHGTAGSPELRISRNKSLFYSKHRQECLSLFDRIFGHGPSVDGDFIVINFFALEGWSLAELFCVRCVIAAPYVVPYSAPVSFERQFKKKFPFLYKYLQEAPVDKDPITGLLICHDRFPSPLLLYGFSKVVVECPDYWPPNVRICGFWFLPTQWQFSCKECRTISESLSPGQLTMGYNMCVAHVKLQSFLSASLHMPPIFVGLSSIGSMGFLKNPIAFVRVLQTVVEMTSYRFILFSAGYEPLDAAARVVVSEESISFNDNVEKLVPTEEIMNLEQMQFNDGQIYLSGGRLICFSGFIPYNWLFPKCAVAVHHGGSGSTAAALHAGIPQVICPFMGDQFYWAERMSWLGVAPEPLKRHHLLPDEGDSMSIRKSADLLSKAINSALSPQVKFCASKISDQISFEDGVSNAIKILKEACCSMPNV